MNKYLSLLRTEWSKEFKDITSWLSTLQYVLASTFIVYLIFRDLSGKMWLALFWVIAIFSLINASVSAFKDTFSRDYIWLYQLYTPENVLISKLIFSIIKSVIMLLVLWGMMILFFGQAIRQPGGFFLSLVLAALNFSAISHLVNAIAHRTDRSQSLYPVLSLPLIIPVILELYNMGAITMGLNPAANNWASDASILTGLGLIFSVAALFLIPYVWKE
ncbi:MAG TPA: ABC transporter permease [Membranihabitans sp.]|nr:ABC transporter permease [Membranihabitans sp.]